MSGSRSDPNNPLPGILDISETTNVGGSYGYGLVGGRAGYAMDRTLFYVKSGAVFTNTQTRTDGSCPGCPYGTMTSVNSNTSGNSNSVGYGIGGGVEYALPFAWSDNISIKTEYLYLGIDRTQTSTGNANGSWLDIPQPEVPITNASTISGIHTAKIGVNYKF
jgi:outer membrane immunogenic protein